MITRDGVRSNFSRTVFNFVGSKLLFCAAKADNGMAMV
jgi:hypothetical protein